MNIAQTQYTLDTGSFEIYVSGCRHRCSEECHNKELWDFMNGEKYTQKYFDEHIKAKVEDFDDLVSKISIFGGEPLDQNHKEFISLLSNIKSLNKEVWLFTSYPLENVPEDVKQYCDYIKTGAYIPLEKSDDNIQFGVKLASKNQKITKIEH